MTSRCAFMKMTRRESPGRHSGISLPPTCTDSSPSSSRRRSTATRTSRSPSRCSCSSRGSQTARRASPNPSLITHRS
ncbi:ATP-binding cassette sub-family A member 2 [Clarias magur]|uniref:ATP-binding cassette sub-family A member 2 n=1 Tax=Clarias magur TaxID=1594786 RepID=A0A8J4X975_CLAMG|nr:ATP-binding cassette sub-family A member 2 [Clarias magur]